MLWMIRLMSAFMYLWPSLVCFNCPLPGGTHCLGHERSLTRSRWLKTRWNKTSKSFTRSSSMIRLSWKTSLTLCRSVTNWVEACYCTWTQWNKKSKKCYILYISNLFWHCHLVFWNLPASTHPNYCVWIHICIKSWLRSTVDDYGRIFQ